jgi:hypothetical protein
MPDGVFIKGKGRWCARGLEQGRATKPCRRGRPRGRNPETARVAPQVAFWPKSLPRASVPPHQDCPRFESYDAHEECHSPTLQPRNWSIQDSHGKLPFQNKSISLNILPLRPPPATRFSPAAKAAQEKAELAAAWGCRKRRWKTKFGKWRRA